MSPSSSGSPPAFTLVSCWAYFLTLTMEACSSETSVDFQWTTHRCIPEDRTLPGDAVRNSHPRHCDQKLIPPGSQWLLREREAIGAWTCLLSSIWSSAEIENAQNFISSHHIDHVVIAQCWDKVVTLLRIIPVLSPPTSCTVTGFGLGEQVLFSLMAFGTFLGSTHNRPTCDQRIPRQ
jgi:hypothetical protein